MNLLGLVGAASNFQCMMNSVRRHTSHVAVYMDAIIVFGQEWGQHIQRVG